MGKICPICGEWSSVRHNITVHGGGATKAEDVIAQRLSCGHTVGGEEYDEFVRKSHDIDKATEAKVRSLKQTNAAKKAALWKTLSPDSEGSE